MDRAGICLPIADIPEAAFQQFDIAPRAGDSQSSIAVHLGVPEAACLHAREGEGVQHLVFHILACGRNIESGGGRVCIDQIAMLLLLCEV